MTPEQLKVLCLIRDYMLRHRQILHPDVEPDLVEEEMIRQLEAIDLNPDTGRRTVKPIDRGGNNG